MIDIKRIQELEYSNKIDCQLPYNDVVDVVKIFEEGRSISSNSVFRFLEEIIYQLKSKKLSKKKLASIRQILQHVDYNFQHPLKKMVFDIFLIRLSRTYLPQKRGMSLMNKICNEDFKNYSVLNIVYVSVRRNRSTHIVDDLYNKITTKWKS